MGTWYVLLQRWHLEVAVVLGFLLDLLLGDPEHWFHPVRLIGGLVRELERRLYPKAGPPVAAFWNGLFLWLCCVGAVGGSVYLLTGVLRQHFFLAGFAFEILLSYQLLAARCLSDSAAAVARALKEGGLTAGRKAVSYIVGRDTEELSEAAVIRATVETVAENTSDGEIAPLFFLIFFGVAGGWVYKAVIPWIRCSATTMRATVSSGERQRAWMMSSIGYRQGLPRFFLMVAAALGGQDAGRAFRIFDGIATATRVQTPRRPRVSWRGPSGSGLRDPTRYFGEIKEKPYIGDDTRDIETADIARANRMLFLASWIGLVVFLLARVLLEMLMAGLALKLQPAALAFPNLL